MTSNPLVIGGGAVEIYDPTGDIEEDYGKYLDAKVDNSDKPHVFYVVYDKKDFARSSPVVGTLVPSEPLSGKTETITLAKPVASAQGFDLSSTGIVLFEHPNYAGNGLKYRGSQKDLRKSFPTDKFFGVSSIIVMGGKWEVYGARNHKPPLIKTLTEGLYPAGFNDKVQSIKRI